MLNNKNEQQKNLLSIEQTINDLLSSIENSFPTLQVKFEKFVEEFNKEFPINTNPENRGRAEAITWALMDGPLVLYGLGLNGPAIIELHGILERFAIRETINLLASPSKHSHIYKVLQRRSLSDIASLLRDIGIFNKEDINFVSRLNTLRNGLAHKNPKIISNFVQSGKNISVLDINSVMTEVDCVNFILETVCLLIKLSRALTERENRTI